jgi:hypothetical protein
MFFYRFIPKLIIEVKQRDGHINEHTCGCMSSAREQKWHPTIQLLSSPEPTQSLLRLLQLKFPRVSQAFGASAENVRIAFSLRTTLDLRQITEEDVDRYGVGTCFNPDEKNVLHMLRQVSEDAYRTHPSLDYGLPYARARDHAHAKVLLQDFCDRMVTWGLAKFGERTREWYILDKLRSINSTLNAGDMTDFQAMAVPDDQIGLCGYSLRFEVDSGLYDIREIVAVLQQHAHTYAPASIGSINLANMPTLLDRLHKSIY